MANQVIVEICMGTACYLMGAAQLASIGERMPEAWKTRVTIRGIRCEGMCQKSQAVGKAPYVRVNDQLISEADEGKVLAAIRAVLDD